MIKILQGRHYSGLIPFPRGIHFGLEFIEYKFVFNGSCRYYHGEVDQGDWNKLFGLSWGVPHAESARIAWRFVPDRDLVEIAAYPYVSGESQYGAYVSEYGATEADRIYKIGEAIIGREHCARIYAPPGKQVYELEGQNKFIQEESYQRGPGFILGAYFGGNRRAPHRISITMHRIRYFSDLSF